MSQAVADSLEELVKHVYVLVLGVGFAVFTSTLVDEALAGDFRALQLLYFLALYHFLSYDWLAYTSLIDSYPYDVAPGWPFHGHGRFYVDLLALLVKSVLIFLATKRLTGEVVTTVAALLAAWHLLILLWHSLARFEYDHLPSIWQGHASMICLYGGYAAVVGVFHRDAAPAATLVLPLCLVVVGYSLSRKRTLIERLHGDERPAPATADD